jgi:predicted DNA-binding transcriptional regulator YafY
MRVDRLLAIVMYLLDRGRATAPELARHFETSERTIYRDIESLGLAGVPIVSQSGPGGGYSLAERYTLNRGYLTPDEVLGLIGALDGIASATAGGPINQAVDKIRALTPRAEAASIPPSVTVSLYPWGGQPQASSRADIIKAAIESRNLVEFSYIDMAGKTSLRRVEPFTLALGGLVWYLHGFCLLRKEWRLFRLSRISGLRALGERYDPLRRLPAPAPWGKAWGDEWELMKIRLRFSPEARLTVMDSFSPEQVRENEDGSFLVSFGWMENDPPVRFVLGFGPLAEVLEPASLRSAVRAAAEQIAATDCGQAPV